jgi:predicted nucleotidyltransferase
LVGAAALTYHLPGFHRQTYDLDIAVAISLDELPVSIRKLAGWNQNPRREQEWRSPEGVIVDIIPVGPDLLEAGYVVWPQSGHRMSLLGFRHVFERIHSVPLGPESQVNIATVPTIALLKIIAYQERPGDRGRDLGDIADILVGYLPDDDPRRFTPEIIATGLNYEETCSFILGRELAEMVNEPERLAIESFISTARDESDGGRTQALMLQSGPPSWRSNPGELLLKLEALERGLKRRYGASSSPGP